MRGALLPLAALAASVALAAALAPSASRPESRAAHPEAPRLGGDLEPLRGEFNRRAAQPRLLAVLSPACPVCLAGAQAVSREILEPDTGFAVLVVWSEVLPFDRDSKVGRRVDLFAGRGEVAAFQDPGQWAPRRLAAVLGWPPGERAWDVYLFYAAGVRWEDELPAPSTYVHQRASIEDGRYRTGVALRQALREAAGELAAR
jgi:hypothetical protein